MSSYYNSFNSHQHPGVAHPVAPSHSHHNGRSRRGPRVSTSQNSHRPFRAVKSMKELPVTDPAMVTRFRENYEAARAFDFEDDLTFCPGLLTESEMHSYHSGSDRSSLSSGSPESSPTQQAQTVAPPFSLNSQSNPYIPTGYSQASMKLHQPAATRTRNAIPIVNPSTGTSMQSPSPSASPARLAQGLSRRWQ